MSDETAILEGRKLTKRFGPTKALDEASFVVRRGRAHALLGENGAGKSTTIKLLSGLIRPDSGEILVDGRVTSFREPQDAHRAGIQTAFQELTLARDLTVQENMLLGYEPVGLGDQIDRRAARRIVTEHFEAIGIRDIDPRSDVRDLSLNQRQRVEIARALLRGPKILCLDEATSTLSGRDIAWLGDVIAHLKAEGVTIMMITHKMQEVYDYCDDVTVLRNGRSVGSFVTSSVSHEELVRLIIGRSIEATFPPKVAPAADGLPLLQVSNLKGGKLSGCSFALNRGEILGVAGLQGMGQNELFQTLFGVRASTAGEIRLDGAPVAFASPRQAIDAGLALVPEERKTEGLFLELTGRENVSAAVLPGMARFGVIDRSLELRAASAFMAQVQVHQRALYTRAAAFSGGNQQKLVVAKWLLTQPRLLLLFDPCRGVDVGTKHEIYLLINQFAAAGGAVLLYSSETPELVNLCSRVLVLYDGRVVCTLSEAAGEISETEIMAAAIGQRAAKASPVPSFATAD